MNKNHILLSISMLISGRDEMEKSLNSLLYFKNAFPTEIILVDTGCNAEQRALAEKYADKIINFTWCNDFAAARNVGLKEARGEWFMYLDDDEWFDNPVEIISFFTTGEYKKYKSASYEVRNYLGLEGKSFKTSYPSRMVRREKNTCFIGKIHEYINPFDIPQKEFSDFVHHYGYVYKSDEERVQHAARNIEPLVEMRKEYPGETRWMFQLAQEYFAVRNYEKTIKVCIEGLEEWEKYKTKVKFFPVYIGVLYSYILLSLECMKEYQKEELWLERAKTNPIMDMPIMEVCKAYYYMIGARLYNATGNYELCIDNLEKYVSEAERLRNNRTVMETETAGIVTSVFHNEVFTETVMMCIGTIIKKEKYEYASKLFNIVSVKDIQEIFQVSWAKKLMDAMCSKEYNDFFVQVIQSLYSGEKISYDIVCILMELKKEYRQEQEIEKLNNLIHLMAELDSGHFFIISNKIIWEQKKANKEETLNELYNELLTTCADHLFEVEDEVWNIAIKEKIDVNEMILKVDYRVWRRALERMEQWATWKDWEAWNDRILAWKRNENIHYNLFDIKYRENGLIEEIMEWVGLSKLEEDIWTYTEKLIDFYKSYYKEEVLLENSVGLPDELQLALELKKQKEYCESGQDRKALEHLKNCLGIYPKLEKVMLTYAEMVRNKMQQQITEAKEAQEELQQMVISLKNIAKQKLESGETAAAKAILSQVQQYAPDDDEIKTLLHNLEEEVQ